MPQSVSVLRQLWHESRESSSPGLNPDEVFDELERKYEAMVIRKLTPLQKGETGT